MEHGKALHDVTLIGSHLAENQIEVACLSALRTSVLTQFRRSELIEPTIIIPPTAYLSRLFIGSLEAGQLVTMSPSAEGRYG